jgi:hypothetical protein
LGGEYGWIVIVTTPSDPLPTDLAAAHAVGLIGGLILRQREDRTQSTLPIVDHSAGDTTINLGQQN